MLVREFMTTNVVTISSETTISEALYTMRKKKIRRLPLIENGKLVGIVTAGDLREVSPSPATSLSVWELNYVLAKITVNDFAAKKLITISPDATVEEAAMLMRKNKIGGLPVVEGDTLVGIITGIDILDAFIEIMGYKYPGERIVLKVEDKAGVLSQVAEIIKEEEANITSMAMYHKVPGFAQLVMRLNTKDSSSVIDKLKQKGYTTS